MENSVKRIGYLPRKRVLEIIDKISENESISRSKVVGILVEEALDARGIANFGFVDKSSLNTNILESNLSKTEDVNNKYFAEDEFVDDSGYTVPNKNKLKQNISTSDIELANKINLLRKSGLI
tara:strand:+ start:1906 stop:2274 length:369 start_codon:yes stop_codon:yes gene_type:complete